MRKLIAVASLVLALLAGSIGAILAQEATPSGDTGIPGAKVEVLAQEESSDGMVGMTLYRITLEPGVKVPEHEHFGSVTWYVDSGELTITVSEGEAWVRCAADCVPGGEKAEDGSVRVPLGQEVVLQPGDWMFQRARTVHAYNSTGDTDAVIDASTSYTMPDAEGGATPAGGPRHKLSCHGGCM